MTAQIAEESPVPLRQDATVIALVGLAHAISHFCHLLLPPLFPVFIRDFGLSYTDLGFLVTLFFAISGVGQALSGFVVDRFGAHAVLFVALTCFVWAALAASMATGYGGLCLAAALAGLGNSPFHPVDFTILNQRVSPGRLGYAFSVHGLSGNLGWALTPVWLVAWMQWSGSWRLAYVACAVLIAMVLVTLWWHRSLLQVTIVHRSNAKGNLVGLGFLRLPVVWWCFGFFFFSTMTLAMVQSFGAGLLRALYDLGFETATVVVSAYMLASALGMLVGGWMAARVMRSDRVVIQCLVAGAVLLGICATGWLPSWAMIGLLVSTGLAIGIGGPSRDLMIRKATPREASGRVYGTVYSGLDAGLALSPLIFGLLMDRQHYNLVLLGGAAVLLAGALMALGIGTQSRSNSAC